MRGPTKPVCRDSEPCQAPAVGVILQFRRNGSVVAQVKTGEAGRYMDRLRGRRHVLSGENDAGKTMLLGIATDELRAGRPRS
jgi:hypothetical protein